MLINEMTELTDKTHRESSIASPKVCIIARKKLRYNARIVKQAIVLAKAGYDINIISLAEKGLPDFERTRYYRLHRIKLGSYYQRKKYRFNRLKKINNYVLRKLKGDLRLVKRRFFKVVRYTFAIILVPLKKIISPGLVINIGLGSRLLFNVFKAVVSLIQFIIRPFRFISLVFRIEIYLENGFIYMIRLLIIRPFKLGYKLCRVVIIWGQQVTNTYIIRLRNLLTSIMFFVRSLEIICRNPANIYHAHDSYPLLVAYIASKLHKAKLVYDAVEFSPDRNKPNGQSISWLSKIIERNIINRANEVITIGESLSSLIAQTYNIEKPEIIMNCHKYKRESTTRILSDQLELDTRKIILYTGSITKNNGLEQLIMAAPYLINAAIVIMGPTTFRGFNSDLKALVNKMGMQDQVFIIEPVNPKKVISYASSAHMGVIPIQRNCLNHSVAFPNKLFEYIMARLPIATGKLTDVSQLVESQQIGVVFDETDPKSIGDVINQTLLNNIAYQQMKVNLNRCASIYCWEKEAEKLVDIYTNLNSGA